MNLDNTIKHYNDNNSLIEAKFVNENAFKLVSDYVQDNEILSLGLGNGHLGKLNDNICYKQIIIEGSKQIIDSFSFESDKTIFIESYFENFKIDKKFDVILANHVLEHVDNPVNLMKLKFNEWLSDDGIAFITVPNAKSIHRLIGKEMGMLANEYDFNNSDLKAGHKRIYDIDQLTNDVNEANLEIIEFGGYNIKIVSLAQMKDWSQELLNSIFEVSKQLPPEICANIWMKVKKKS